MAGRGGGVARCSRWPGAPPFPPPLVAHPFSTQHTTPAQLAAMEKDYEEIAADSGEGEGEGEGEAEA